MQCIHTALIHHISDPLSSALVSEYMRADDAGLLPVDDTVQLGFRFPPSARLYGLARLVEKEWPQTFPWPVAQVLYLSDPTTKQPPGTHS